MRQFFFMRSSLLLPILAGFCASTAHSAPPQIIEVHKDPSISDEDRMSDMDTYQFYEFIPSYKTACRRDTTYWVVSTKVYPSNERAYRDIPDAIKPKLHTEKAYHAAGFGATGNAVLPTEFLSHFKGHFILVGGGGRNTKSNLALLRRRYEKDLITITEEDDGEGLGVHDTNEIIDSALPENKARAIRLGKEMHALIPEVTDNPFVSNYANSALILGACLGGEHAQRIASIVDSKFYVFRLTK